MHHLVRATYSFFALWRRLGGFKSSDVFAGFIPLPGIPVFNLGQHPGQGIPPSYENYGNYNFMFVFCVPAGGHPLTMHICMGLVVASFI